MDELPPFSWSQALTNWQFAPVVTGVTIVMAALYIWGMARVQRRHPARPWPLWRAGMFLLGLLVVAFATEGGVGTYDDTLFWDHMIQHLMLLMIAPPLLVTGQPATLLLHASRNPLHTWAKRVLRSGPVHAITAPAFGVAAYAATVVLTHLTSFMNVAESNDSVHDLEHVLFLVVGYIYFLPLIGKEPIGWKVSYPVRLFLLFIAMPVDAFTGVILGSETSLPFTAFSAPRGWGPSPIDDIHLGGAVMWIGGAAIMFVLILTTFFAWSRETRPTGGMGWLESVRRSNLATVTTEGRPEHSGPAPAISESADLDADQDSLDAYNAYLARLNSPAGHAGPPGAE
ncbi:MAG TPA: cytochrome c oxidase assembly protein [Trebonia sp.]|jgi:putative copper resistance protein D|nr:cytochrome c oxidase assembly protein [Trebonia sp.]